MKGSKHKWVHAKSWYFRMMEKLTCVTSTPSPRRMLNTHFQFLVKSAEAITHAQTQLKTRANVWREALMEKFDVWKELRHG